MATNETGTITLRILAQDLASGNIGKFIGNIDRLAKQGGLMGSVMQGVGQSFGQMLNPVALVAKGIGTVTDFMGDSITAASDQAEALSKVTVVFGDQADEIKAWAKTAAESMGMSETAALSAAGTLGNLFDALGIADKASADMSKTISQLAADLASFNNVPVADAIAALQAGLVGETEPMRRFGSNISAARVEAYALAKGMAATKGAITDAIKVQARYGIILEDTKNAQGDFARTSDGLANSSKTLDAKMKDLTVSVGQFLQEPAKGFVGFLTDVIDGITNPTGASPAIQQMISDIREATAAVKAAAGPVETFAQAFERVNKEFKGNALSIELGAFTEEAKAAHEWAKALGPEFIAMSGEPVKAFRLLAEASKAAGETFQEFRARAFAVANGTSSIVISMVDPWMLGLRQMSTGAVEAGKDIYGGLVKPVKRAMRDMFKTATDAKAPWKEAMKALATAGKDPFSDKKFAGWMEKKARRFVNNARREFREGKGDNRKAAQALADVMTNPILRALATTQEEIQALVNAMATVNLIRSSTGTGRMGSNQKVAGRAAGGPVYAGQTYVVGELGPEVLRMGSGSGNGHVTPNNALGGVTVNVTFNSVTTPSEAEGQRLAAAIAPHIQRHMARAGG